jgi:hypothetical protein
MDRRFAPLNALIAFCSSTQTSWPRPFFDAGYQLQALEFPVPTGDSRVAADVVAWSPTASRFALGEAKSGANVDEGQARRYASVQANTLIQMTGVTLTQATPVRAQALYAVLAEEVDRVLLGLSRAGVSFPVLAVSDDSVWHTGADLDHRSLAERFADPISVPGPPPGIITIDVDSSDEDFDRVVQASLAAILARNLPATSTPALAEDALPYLALYPNGYRSRLVRRVEAAARRAVEAAPETFAFVSRTGTSDSTSVRVLDSPEGHDPRGRTQRYQALASRFTSPHRRRPAPVDTDQLSLFGQDDLEQQLAELDLEEDNGAEEVADGPQ